MTFEDANEAALGAVGEALKAWCRQQADALIAEGKTEAEAIAELNARDANYAHVIITVTIRPHEVNWTSMHFA